MVNAQKGKKFHQKNLQGGKLSFTHTVIFRSLVTYQISAST